MANIPERIRLTEQNAGQTVDARVGQEVAVNLPENATTGYRWTIEQVDANLIDTHDAAPQYPSGPVGSGGRVEWVFRPKAPGTTSIVLKHWRPWEGDTSIVERFSTQLRIAP